MMTPEPGLSVEMGIWRQRQGQQDPESNQESEKVSTESGNQISFNTSFINVIVEQKFKRNR